MLAIPGAIALAVTSTTIAGWHSDNDDGRPENDDYYELYERLNLTYGIDLYLAGLRLDTATFVGEPVTELEDRYTPEKVWVGRNGRILEATLGDAYVSFGRGLSLSLRKIDELGVDTTLRGAKLLLHGGAVSAQLVAGTPNPGNVDEASGRSIDDPYDLCGGAEVHVRLGERLTVGAQAAAVAFHDGLVVPVGRWEDVVVNAGPTLEAPRLTDRIGVYLEGIAQVRTVAPDEERARGFGAYGAATIALGPTTLLVEGKAYGDLRPLAPSLPPAFSSVVYATPPTVERVLQILDHPQRRVYGGRVRADWSLAPELLGYASYGVFRDHEGYANPRAPAELEPATIFDPYVGVERRWDDARSRALLSTGYRLVLLDETQHLVRGDLHGEYDLVQALPGRFSLELSGLHDEREKITPSVRERFREGTVQLGLRYHPFVTIAGGYDYTTEPTQPKRDSFSGSVQWDVTPSSSVRLFAGASRGGLRCVSGVCRTFPPFEGVKVTATIRF